MAGRVHELLVNASRRSAALRLLVYLREVGRLGLNGGGAPDLLALARTFPSWQRSLKPEASPLQDRQPWITYAAIDFLARTLTPAMRVFEFGAGGSSIFFAERVAQGFSVEHDPAWGEQVRATLARDGVRNWSVSVIPSEPAAARPDPGDADGYGSDDPPYRDRTFRAYASAINAHPDRAFDLVLVDGRARPSCVKHAMPKVAPGGWLMLDNAERPYYAPIHRTLDAAGWTRQVFRGPGPYSFGFWETSAWQRGRG
jgi:predicted O-methyltransferase YrrM